MVNIMEAHQTAQVALNANRLGAAAQKAGMSRLPHQFDAFKAVFAGMEPTDPIVKAAYGSFIEGWDAAKQKAKA